MNTILNYFFEITPSGRFDYMYLFIILAVITLILSIAGHIYLKQHKGDKIFRKLFSSVPGKLQMLAILLGLYVFVRYERMPFLSMRFLNYIILGTGIYLLIRYAKIYLKIYPEAKRHHENQLKLNKYLPRKKSK